MSKIDEFKLFVRENPRFINKVKENKTTWQSLYEMYDIYGSDNKVWDEYLKEETESKETNKNNKTTINDIINMAKNMDVDKVQEGITSIQKAISLFSDLFTKNDNNPNSSSYTPRPVYRSFED